MKAPHTAIARGVSESAGVPAAPSWAGYWTWTTAVIILMFVLYLAQQGRLGVWLQFFSWTSPAPIATAGASSSSSSQTPSGLLSGATGQGGAFAGGSTDPVIGSVNKALQGLPGGFSLPGSSLGLGN